MLSTDVALPPPTPQSLLAFAPLEGAFIAVIALALAAWYLFGAIRLWSQRRTWSVLRTIVFLLGSTLLFLVGTLGVNSYATDLVSALLFQQITLMTVIPPLLIIGSPGRLLLRSTPHRGLGIVVLRTALGGLRSKVARTALHPAVAVLIVAVLYLGLYLSDLVSVIIGWPFGHGMLLIVFLTAGITVGVPLWSSDPMPRVPSYGARLGAVIVEIQIHAIFGLVLLLTPGAMFAAFATPPLAWGITPGIDQQIAGTLLWTYAELPLLIVLIVILSRWRTRDIKMAKITQTRDDDDLDRYNEYLATLKQPGA